MPRLENWAPDRMIKHLESGRFAIKSLIGRVYDDEENRFEDGQVITTSQVLSINQDQTEARTMNAVYKLGKPVPEWEAVSREHDIDLGGYIVEPAMPGEAPTMH